MIIKTRKKIKTLLPKNLDNREGAALIISMFVLTVLFGLTACISLASVTELNESKRYVDSVEAFWAAEAAINRFIQNTAMLDGGDQTIQLGAASVFLTKDDISDSSFRIVTAIATANGMERSIEVRFPVGIPSVYDHTMSTGGDIGYLASFGSSSLDINGQTQLSGSYSEGGFFGTPNSNIEIIDDGVDSGLTTLTYADEDGNGTADEFNDFQKYYREMTDTDDPNYTGEYANEEVLYLPTDGIVNLSPASELNGKKVIFVDGGEAGTGQAFIWLDTSWAAQQNMTVVATGSVVFIQPLENPVANSSLHTVSWENYAEAAIVESEHTGTNYAHNQALVAFAGGSDDVSTTNGSIIANNGVGVALIGSAGKEYDYVNPVDDEGAVPPGFQGLVSGGGSGFSDTPSTWSEI